ncbi:hypothetical protein OFC51_33310, partial [Escherichia coli]|nr:hypothetical protein [Escherichia coli]
MTEDQEIRSNRGDTGKSSNTKVTKAIINPTVLERRVTGVCSTGGNQEQAKSIATMERSEKANVERR